MGNIAHHAIVVTGINEIAVVKAHNSAGLWGLAPSAIMASPVNGFLSFFIGPDGSNEGREASNDYDKARKNFRAQLRKTGLTYVEVCYGDELADPCEASVVESDQTLVR